MKFNLTALGLTAGLFWGGAIFFVALANMMWPPYGRVFLELVASVYPGYQPATDFGAIAIATLYGVLDGAIGGAAFGLVYNWLARERGRAV